MPGGMGGYDQSRRIWWLMIQISRFLISLFQDAKFGAYYRISRHFSARILKVVYFPDSNLLSAMRCSHLSQIWRAMVDGIRVLHNGMILQIDTLEKQTFGRMVGYHEMACYDLLPLFFHNIRCISFFKRQTCAYLPKF